MLADVPHRRAVAIRAAKILHVLVDAFLFVGQPHIFADHASLLFFWRSVAVRQVGVGEARFDH